MDNGLGLGRDLGRSYWSLTGTVSIVLVLVVVLDSSLGHERPDVIFNNRLGLRRDLPLSFDCLLDL